MAEFVIGGRRVILDRDTVVERLNGVAPEPVQKHAVDVAGVLYPVVQALEVGSGVPRQLTRSARARDVLSRLGFTLVETHSGHRAPVIQGSSTEPMVQTPTRVIPSASIADAAVQLSTPRVRLGDLIADAGLLKLEGTGLYAIYGRENVWSQFGLSPVDDRPLLSERRSRTRLPIAC